MDITKITPISTIKILRGVRVDSSLNDVMSHANKTAQFNYFNAKTKYTCTNAVPVRNNVVRVPFTADQLYDCNYIMWQNANFADKWFYGFIGAITWINVSVSEIEIQPDPWETWQFDLTFKPCFVERHHVNIDTTGRWKAPEPFDISGKLFKLRDVFDFKYRIAVFYMPEEQYLPSGVDELKNMCVVDIVSPGDFDSFFQEHIQPLIDVGLQNNVLGAVMVPDFIKNNGKSIASKTLSKSKYMNLSGYVPANKKLLTYPYNSLRVATQNGMQGEYWFENFASDNMSFVVGGCVSLDMMLYGDFQTYERVSSTPEGIPNQPYTNVVSGFPQPLFSGLQSIGFAQAASGLAMQAIAGVKDAIGGMSLSLSSPQAIRQDNWLGRLVSGMDKTISYLPRLAEGSENDLKRAATPDYSVVTSLPASTSAWSVFRGGFQFLHSTIDAKRAEMYDAYLTRWGYAINEVTTPNLSGRKVFNYVKTNGVVVYGNVNESDINQIRSMFDRGITIWHEERGYVPGDFGGAPAGNPIV